MKVRARGAYALAHPKSGVMVVVTPGDPDRDDGDAIVQEFPWAFEPVGVETASAAPGEKRTTRRKKATPKAAPTQETQPEPPQEPAQQADDGPKEGFGE